MGLTKSGAPRASYKRRRRQRNDQEVSERSAAVQSCRSEPKLVLGSINVRLFLLLISAVTAVKSFSPALPTNGLSWLGGSHHHQRMCRVANGRRVSRIANASDWKALLGILAAREGDVVETRL
jgi:hypothetical protein